MSNVSAKTYTSLSAIAAAATGTIIRNRGHKTVSWYYTTTGSPTGVNVRLEGSGDGTNFDTIGEAVTNTTYGAGEANATQKYYRLNGVTLSGGTAPTITGKLYFV